MEFIQKIKPHLAINGKIVIAIENKLGLKYWAGCKEDHTGKYFQGIEGYHNVKRVKTFGKNTLTSIIRDRGFSDDEIQFFYPFPDYKFPTQIFSDLRLPKKFIRAIIHPQL